MKIRLNRWYVLLGALLAMPCAGAVYTWSLFNNHLMENFGWLQSEVVLAYSIALFMVAFSTMFAGKLQDKFGPRLLAIIGGLLYGSGLMLSSTASTLAQLYIYFGIIAGTGVGFVYICALSTCVKWFPERKGLISGVVLGAFGLGSFIFSPLVQYLIELAGVSTAFFYLGLVYLTLILTGSMFLVVPEKAALPAHDTTHKPITKTHVDYTTGEMLKTKNFYLIWSIFFLACTSGHLIISSAADIGLQLANLTLTAAAAAVAIISLFNTAGRIVWGAVSDKIGRFRVLSILLVITAVTMILMSITSLNHITFFVYVGTIAFSFGGFLAIFPSITGEFYGLKNMGANYGVVFQAFGVAALTVPLIVANTETLESTFIVAAILAIIGAVITFFMKDANSVG